jgi:hypothetical protein
MFKLFNKHLNKRLKVVIINPKSIGIQKAPGSVPVKNSPPPSLLLPTTTIISFNSGLT